MTKLRDIKERIHQPFYDTLVRGIGISTISNLYQLYGNANIGDRSRTNLQVAGQFSSDSFFIVKAIRMVLGFVALGDPAFNVTNGNDVAIANATNTADRAEDLYTLCVYGAYFTATVGQKPMLTAPLWYAPAGGGPFGSTTVTDRHVITNGMPTQEAILKLAKDITVAPRQAFNVAVEWFPFTRLTANGQGGAINLDLDTLTKLNAFDGAKLIQCMLDGILTRDVQ
jgi:hypothetical protein